MELALTAASVAQIVVLPLFPSDIYEKYLSFLCGFIQIVVLTLVSYRCFNLSGNVSSVVYVSCVALLYGSSSTSKGIRYGLVAAIASICLLLGSGDVLASDYFVSSISMTTLLLVLMPYDYLHLSKYELIILSSALFACTDDCMRMVVSASTGLRVSYLGQVFGLVEIAVLTCVVYGVLCFHTQGLIVQTFKSRTVRLSVYVGGFAVLFGCSAHVLMTGLLGENPALWLVRFLGEHSAFRNVYICVVWVAVLVVSVPLIKILSETIGNRAISRKLFHTLAMALFVPVISWYTEFILLAFGVGVCGLLLAEYVRNAPSVLPELSRVISGYYGTFIDHRDVDRGLVLTHIYLLLGIALPVWLWAVLAGKQEGWFETSGPVDYAASDPHLKLLKHLGWITVGAGDAMGAFVGIYCGRTSWPKRAQSSSRTVEGSLGCFITMLACTAGAMHVEGLLHQVGAHWWPVAATSLLLTTMVEAYTIDIDNLVLPVFSCGIYLVLLQLTIPFSCT
jgi:hypothetical protein